MSKIVIMRPVFNRPEMLKLSIDYEIKAREFTKYKKELHTLFIIEYGADPKVIDLVKEYPYSKTVIERPKRFGLSANILEGFKTAFSLSDSHVVYIEDDILIHKTYFGFLNAIESKTSLSNWSVISAYAFNDDGDVNVVRKDRHYAALAPLINKKFYECYVLPHSNNNFYHNPSKYVCDLNNKYKKYQADRIYRYKDNTHCQQAGLQNRLTDVARIELGMYVVMPEVNRMQHIGFYGFNRPGGKIPGDNFQERLDNLSHIIKSAKSLYNATGSKQYNDYRTFSEKLDKWSGDIIVSPKEFVS